MQRISHAAFEEYEYDGTYKNLIFSGLNQRQHKIKDKPVSCLLSFISSLLVTNIST